MAVEGVRVGHKGGGSEKLCSCSSGEDAVARWNTGTAFGFRKPWETNRRIARTIYRKQPLSPEGKRFDHSTSRNRTPHVHGLTSSWIQVDTHWQNIALFLQTARTTTVRLVHLPLFEYVHQKALEGTFNSIVVVWKRHKIAIQPLPDSSCTVSAILIIALVQCGP